MSIDMSLISIKDGGRFAMSWVAGTNPKALRTNFQRARIITVDIPEVCEHMMQSMKSKDDKISFRILYRLCFGTIRIFSEQVQHLYNVTMSFVCFNTLVLNHYSRKRHHGSTDNKSNNKRRCIESSNDLDITSLLLESEIFNDCSDEQFKLPNQVGINREKRQSTSTCIQIKQITIRQISWDNPLPDEDEAFGEATHDDRMMLLSGLSDASAVEDSNSRKRKSSIELTDCSPFKRNNGILNETIDDIRYAPSICNDTMSEFSVDLRNRPSSIMDKDIPADCNGNSNTQSELNFTQEDLFSQYPQDKNATSKSNTNVETLSDVLKTTSECIPSCEIQKSTVLKKLEPQKLSIVQRKRRQSHLIIDKFTKLSKMDIDTSLNHIWLNCHNYDKREHIARLEKFNTQEVFNLKIPSRRFQSAHLLFRFKNNIKSRKKQDEHIARELILKDIIGDESAIYKSDFKLKSPQRCSGDLNTAFELREIGHRITEIQNLPENIDMSSLALDENNNSFESNRYYESTVLAKNVLPLKCTLNEIDPYAISFDFPTEAGKQRSEWGKEGILLKLLLAWISETPNINMSTIIVGASRINAALAFHTLLDLAGLQYIEIIKNKTNSIESIKMGPELIRKINEKFAFP